MTITGFRNGAVNHLIGNDLNANFTATSASGGSTTNYFELRTNHISGTTNVTINNKSQFYEQNSNALSVYSGDVTFNLNGTGTVNICEDHYSHFAANLTINRTAKGTTWALLKGAIIDGNFSYSNNSSGDNNIGQLNYPTEISGTINVNILDTTTTTTPGLVRLYDLSNQATGGSILIQNTQGFYVQHDTLKVNAMSITGYSGVGNTQLSYSVITGDVTIASGTKSSTFRTDFKNNVLNGNTVFTINNNEAFWDSDPGNSGSKYNGNLTVSNPGGGAFHFGASDTSEISGNLTLDFDAGESLVYGRFTGSVESILKQLGSQEIKFYVIEVKKSGTGKITLNSPVGISGRVIFNSGNIVSSTTNPLKFQDATAISSPSANSHVIGVVQKTGNDAFTFPIGTDDTYDPVSMTAPSDINDVFSAAYSQTNPDLEGYDTSMYLSPIKKISPYEFWDVKRLNGNSAVILTFTFIDFNGAYITDPSQAVIAHWNGSSWDNLGNGGFTGSTSGTIKTSSAVNNFSPFTFGSTNLNTNPLPLQLISFSAIQADKSAFLRWATAHETSLSYFQIEHSTDGRNFSSIGRTSPGQGKYEFMDGSPVGGLNYYRLKIVGLDDVNNYSAIAVLNFTNKNQLLIYPTLVSDKINIISSEEIISIALYSLSGELVETMLPDRDNQYNLSTFQPGVYIICVKTKDFQMFTQKIRIK